MKKAENGGGGELNMVEEVLSKGHKYLAFQYNRLGCHITREMGVLYGWYFEKGNNYCNESMTVGPMIDLFLEEISM